MRLLLVGAFAYPHDQGSQVYFQEQALALRAAGAEVELASYGPGRTGAAPHPLAGLPFHAIPGWAAPASRRSGPQAAKLLADLLLTASLRRLVSVRPVSRSGGEGAGKPAPSASSTASKVASALASREARDDASFASSARVDPAPSIETSQADRAGRRFDAILAHHAEAALIASYALPATRPPILYCAHTLLEHELPEYFDPLQSSSLSPQQNPEPSLFETSFQSISTAHPGPTRAESQPAPGRARSSMTQAWMSRIGRVIDRRIAARCDGWIALTQSSARVMEAAGDAPGRLLAPPMPAFDDARRRGPGSHGAERRAGPGLARDPAAVARSHGLQPGAYFLYAGNLDPYQDLPLLGAVARLREQAAAGGARPGPQESPGSRAQPGRPLPIVIATQDERAQRFADRHAREDGSGLVVCRMRSAGEANALLAGARASIVPRRSLGGFPIKLANSLAAGVPVVALRAAEWGLLDGRDALIGDLADPVGSLARALERLERDPALAAHLGEGARATHRRQHDPARVAEETLALVAEVVKRRA